MEIWLVEDDPRLRASLSAGLQRVRAGFRVTTFERASDVLGALEAGRLPSVGLIDLGLPEMDGIELISRMLAHHPTLPLIALTVRFDDAAVFGALGKGAIGYLLKDAPPESLASAVEEALSGGSPLSPSVARRVIRQLQPDAASQTLFRLTEREQQVLEELCSGASYREAAARLGVTEGTVHTHVKRVYEKLGATSKAEAVRIAFDSRLVALRHD
ncbi:MAG TPA: response regulator transcription factor [Polyangiaceae bacterium]|jgi:DNA-binding NarL/FixJ family response regulator|nr:response regulator transcription factor [Polyangiaceae bacterium]